MNSKKTPMKKLGRNYQKEVKEVKGKKKEGGKGKGKEKEKKEDGREDGGRRRMGRRRIHGNNSRRSKYFVNKQIFIFFIYDKYFH